MNGDTKKIFIGSILVGLIEKTPEIKVMKAICKVSLMTNYMHSSYFLFSPRIIYSFIRRWLKNG